MSEKLIGYNGKIAYVNLSEQKVDIKELDPQIAKDYLGGAGLSAKLTYDLLSDADYEALKKDPFSDNNPLIFSTGPITGTMRPSSGRYVVTGISPQTGIWGESTSGGFFCISLRNSGFDAIVITGKANSPTYLYVHDGTFEFKDASNVWGKDTYETQVLIKNELQNNNARVSTIGPGGENLVKYAAILNDEGRAAGRCGMGALMGSKNLKALAIHGTSKISVSDTSKDIMRELIKQEEYERKKNPMVAITHNLMGLYGTNGYLDMGMAIGDTPAYYFTETEFMAEKLIGKTIKEDYIVMNYGCAGCTMKCGKTTIVEENGEEIKVDGPEYESVAAFGPLCGVSDSKEVILSHHLCNVLGLDTISAGVSIAFLIYLVENNLAIEKIKQQLGDINIEDIRWGNGDLVLKLVDKISKREGIGNLLAEGTRIMAKELDIDPELAAHVKGLEIPMHDPRAYAGMALGYATTSIGAHHVRCDWYTIESGGLSDALLKIKTGTDRFDISKREKGVANLQNLRAIDDSAINCTFPNPNVEHVVKYVNAVTGFDYNKKSFVRIGERINNIKRVISCNLGITRQDDKLPNIVLKPLNSGRTADVMINLDGNLERYYKERGWDWETGRPTEDKLKELGIQ